MALIKWEPFGEFDRLFDEFQSFSKVGHDLAVDVYEEGDHIVALMHLPGIDPQKINVTVENDFLRVSGTREETKESKEKHYYSKEIRHGSFDRVVQLPASVDKDKVTATFKNGELEVLLPKLPKGKTGAVTVKVE